MSRRTPSIERALVGAALVAAERQRVSAIRMQLLEEHPFWGYLILQLALIPALQLPAFVATDGVYRLWYNPRLTSQLPDSALGFALVHELGHQVFLSAERQGGRQPMLWHKASDYAINRIVVRLRREVGWSTRQMYTPPAGYIEGLGDVEPLLDARYDASSAESIYEHLVAQSAMEGAPGKEAFAAAGAGGEGEAPRADDDTAETVDDLRVDVTLPVDDDRMRDGPGRVIQFHGVLDHRGGVDLHLPIASSLDEREELRDRLHLAVEHWKVHGYRGYSPLHLLRELGVIAEPSIPWERTLRPLMDAALARDEYSRAHPNKRYLLHDVIVPHLHGDRLGSVVIALDTSASLGIATLRRLTGEIRDIAALASNVVLIVADSAVQEVIEGDALDDYLRRAKVRGGGGTDHRPVFSYIEHELERPSLFIGITDLVSAFPKVPPSYPVLWLVPRDHGKAPWGYVIVAEAR